MQTLEEELTVIEWRFDQLVRIGFSRDGAAAVAAQFEVDLHQAAELVANGCPPELALRILL
jgi:hypothetical protein